MTRRAGRGGSRAALPGALLLGLLVLLAAAPADAEPAGTGPAATGEAAPAEPPEPAPAADPAPPAAAGGFQWRFGRTADVFRDAGDALATQVSGFLDASYRDNNRDGFHASFDHVNVSIDTRWHSWQAFVEAEYENNDDLTGYEDESEFEPEQVYLRYTHSDALSLRLGRFNTPFGYWVPVHWSILMDTIERPLVDGYHIVPEQQIGAEVSGRFFPGSLAGLDSEVDYSLYGGWGFRNLDQNGTEGASVGADLRLRLEQRYLLGISAYRQQDDHYGDRIEKNLMLYGEVHLPGDVTFRTEYLYQGRDRQEGLDLFDNIQVVYAKLRWYFHPRAYVNYRFCYGDDDYRGPPSHELIHTFTLGWRPLPAVLAKVELSDHDFRGGARRDFLFWGASVGYRF